MRPLEDLRIIALEQYGAGPFGSVHLADLGAEVIKIEDPTTGGDVGRYIPPFQEGEDSLFFETFNRNKRSLTLDPTTDGGRQILEDLVGQSDAIFSNLRGDVPSKLRITYEDLKHANPRIVCVSLSGYGMTGPRASDPGYDYVIQGLSGWMSLTGEPDGPPAKSGLSLVDYSGGLVAAIALLAGVHAARRDGVGMDCDLGLFDTAISMLTYPATWYLNGGLTPERRSRSAHPSVVPFGIFPAADGWLVIACPKEKFFRRLLEAMGIAELGEDPRFRDFDARRRNAEALTEILDTHLAKHDVSHWIQTLTGAGVPVGPVNDVPTALADPQVEARGLIVETSHPRFGSIRQVASPVRVGPEDSAQRRAPLRDEDRDYVLEDVLGYDADQIMAFAKAGAFGSP